MADRMQFRRDTAANWAAYNPILLEGELGFELDTDQYKLGDGVHNWNDLPYRGGPYVQQRGQSTTAAMSQKAVTYELNLIAVFDISAYNLTDGQPTKYADLAAALGTHGDNVPNVPLEYRRGGMTVKFVQSSNNKYVQFRYMGTDVTGTPNPFLDTANWQGVDDEPTAGSDNPVKSGGIALQNYQHAYAIVGAVNPLYDTAQETVTLPSGTRLAHPNIHTQDHVIILESDIVFERPSQNLQSNILVLNADTLEVVYYNTISFFNLKENEVPIATIRWDAHVIFGNFNYYKDGIFINSTGVPDPSIQNYQNAYAVISENYPEYISTPTKTITLKAATRITNPNIGVVTLQSGEEVVFTFPNDGYQSHHLVYNVISQTVRYVRLTQELILTANEALIGTFKWDEGIFIGGNFGCFYKDGILVSKTGILLPDIQNYQHAYAVISAKYPQMDTENDTFKLLSGTRISNPNIGVITLDSDVVFSKPQYYQSHHLIYNTSTGNVRYVSPVSVVKMTTDEVLIATIKWDEHVIIGGNFDTYYKDGVIVRRTVEGYDELQKMLLIEEYKSKGFFVAETVTASKLIEGKCWLVDERYDTPVSYTIDTFDRLNPILVKEGDVVLVKSKGGQNARAYALTDIEKVIYERGAEYGNYINNPLPVYVLKDGYIYINNDANESIDFSLTIMRKERQSIHRIFNPPVNLKKDNLRILDIGNSYTVDSTHYLPNIISAAGLTDNYSLYDAVRGSASFKTWVNCYNDSDSSTYQVNKIAGLDITEVTTGEGAANDGSLFRNALQNGNWDIIIIHQWSKYSNDYTWNSNTDDGHLKEFIRMIKRHNPQASIGFLLVHSYASTYSSNIEKSSLDRWKNIIRATKDFMIDYGVDFVIPYGTAVQNLRASSINDEYDFSTDGLHMADGIGDYVANCAYFQSVFAPRFNVSILGNTWRKTDFDETKHGVKNIDNTNAALAQMAAYFACYDMFDINNPDDISI